MSDTTDLIKLYSKRILALAAAIPHTDPLVAPMGMAKKRSPLCGSNIQVALDVKDGVISAFSQDVKACALGQASASVVGANIIGRTRDEIETGRDQLFEMLTQNGPVPDAPFADLIVLESAKDYRNRHASIMLAFDATLAAFDDAIQSESA
ncbi:iron-sulfur cluster assembly scaffold protein [Amylibacter kogurei]|uniref:Iron-sulfur cluster assembly scaffold protein n=1 Tax=Paramylibacter kogurei TaxID=1889778 RepID=A0A2G5K563_9RHOB|nr:iron-sulfur cluster assembly scaffold protein [Amylibacter kogurei]PIB24668.1 iron-sulfur cluster assembly scaffold protein [Amylibacter kogurei]